MCLSYVQSSVKDGAKLSINLFFYSTIHIYTEKQLTKIIQLSKERRLPKEDKSIGYFVKCLDFHYFYLSESDDLLSFPKLQSIDGLTDNHILAKLIKKLI
ncbi:unnamed protein product [Cunninghamella blakesleeana]